MTRPRLHFGLRVSGFSGELPAEASVNLANLRKVRRIG